jgi:predicted MFS family arabinose efflux permease
MNRQFLSLLWGETVAATGARIALTLMPLITVSLLHASTEAVGLLFATGLAAPALFGIFGGGVIDRLAKRRVMVVAYAVTALALALVPMAGASDRLSLGLLIAVNSVGAGLVAAAEIAQTSALPQLVAIDALAAANGRVSACMALAGIAAPGLVALVLATLNLSAAMAIDALIFAVAAALLMRLPRLAAPAPEPSTMQSMTARLTEGLRMLSADALLAPALRVMIAARGLAALCLSLEAVFIVRHLGVPASWFALAFAIGGVGGIIGSITAGVLASRFSLQNLLGGALLLMGGARGAMSLLGGGPGAVALGFAACLLVLGLAGSLMNVGFMTALQTRMPTASIGRVFGTISTINAAAMSLGALAGGLLGASLGVRATLMLAACGFLILGMVCRIAMKARGAASVTSS